MQKSTLLLILIAAIGIGSVLYMLGGTSDVNAEPSMVSYTRTYSNPFEKHAAEGVEQSVILKGYLGQVDKLKQEKSEVQAAYQSYQNHIDGYFQSAELEINSIQDSTLRAASSLSLGEEMEKLNGRAEEMKQSYDELNRIATRAEDLAKVIRVMASMGQLEKWAKQNQPATQDMDALLSEYKKLFHEYETTVSGI